MTSRCIKNPVITANLLAWAAAIIATIAPVAFADVDHNDDVLAASICLDPADGGGDCVPGEDFTTVFGFDAGVKIKAFAPMIRLEDISGGGQNDFAIGSWNDDLRIWRLDTGAAILKISENGDLGLNTTAPAEDIHILTSSPVIRLEDTSDGSRVDLDMNMNELAFQGNSDQEIVEIITTAPFRSLRLDGDGYVGLGIDASSKLHLYSSSSTEEAAQVRVQNASAIGGVRTLFKLENNGNTKLEVINTQADTTWAFANARAGFRLSLQDSGVVEFEVQESGNAVLAGALTENSDLYSKQHINAVDQQSVLAKVMDLPVSEWSYKAAPQARHMGPMAQDFHRMFGLGDTDKGIASIDTGGVALAAIQGLKQEKDRELQQLETKKNAEIASLRETLKRQEAQLIQLEMALTELMRKDNQEMRVGSAE